MPGARLVPVDEIRKHESPESCWIVVDGHVWDLTYFAPYHPGGGGSRDASKPYSEVHAPSVLGVNLDASKYVGRLDTNTIDPDWAKPRPKETPELAIDEKPPLHTLINLQDFEEVASRTLSKKTWAFYSSAATDCVTRDRNRTWFERILWRPRVMRNVRTVRTNSRILGHEVQTPFFASPAAMAKLVHPEGELALARACEGRGAMQIDRGKTKVLLEHLLTLRDHGLIAICITVDAAVPGKREADERLKADEASFAPNSGASAPTGGNDKRGGGLGRIMGAFIDPSLVWQDINWIRSIVGPEMPLMVKGIQTAMDARLAVQHGLKGIVVGNHGGRSLDTSPPSVLILLELRRECPEVFDKLEVYVNGGIRRGTDVLKCICLGAKAVGLGRPPLYALNYGQEGVEHMFDILKDELETTMRLVGITDLSQASPELINTLDLDRLVPRSLDRRSLWSSLFAQAKI